MTPTDSHRDLLGIGETISRHRRAAGMTQHQLAAATGLSRQTIARAETGHVVTSDTLAIIAIALGLKLRVA